MQDAGKFFHENQCLFTNPTGKTTEQEKFNLYGGLLTLSKNIDELGRNLKNIEARLSNIEYRLSQLH